MTWATLAYLATGPSASFPASGAELFQVVLGALNVGVCGLVAWLFIAGRLHSDSEVGRLVAERERLVADKAKAEAQRDEALRTAQEKLVPLLTNFVSVTSVLIPLLQQAVASQERTDRWRTEDRGH
jgi:hypothetical protein